MLRSLALSALIAGSPLIAYEDRSWPTEADYIAPDGSLIYLLADARGAGLAGCELPPGATSSAVKHRTVDEIWHFVQGQGELWRCDLSRGKEELLTVSSGMTISIPAGTAFQFRNSGSELLRFVITTTPNWPGPHEAVAVEGRWP